MNFLITNYTVLLKQTTFLDLPHLTSVLAGEIGIFRALRKTDFT